MRSSEELRALLERLQRDLRELFGAHLCEMILFGSYARGDADDGSDLDILVLVDLPRERIVEYRRRVAEIAGELLLTGNLLIAPIVENRDFFNRHRATLPFYRNIDREGVRLSA